MQTNGYIVVESRKYLISATYHDNKVVFTRRDSGKDGIRFTSEEEIIRESSSALDRLRNGKELII